VNVLLRVKDAARSLGFYRALGLREEMLLRRDGRLYFGEMTCDGAGGGALMFLEEPWWTTGRRESHIVYIAVEDVDAVRAAVPPGWIARGPRDEYYGRELLVADPDGHLTAFLQLWPGGERLPERVEAWRR
jgi:catechol 2,3-dioxygenase-like lactoylglutathione lyase family enzyme